MPGATAQPTLEGCREKQRRGLKHLHDLDAAIADWVGEPGVDPKPYRIAGEFRPASREYVYTGQLTKPVDGLLLWGVIFGDAMHNLRSALDHLVWQLVLLNNDEPTRDNQFPICETDAAYLSQRANGQPSTRERQLRGVADKHKALIDEMQPFRTQISPGAMHALSTLRELANQDKHRLIHLTVFAVDLPTQEALDQLFTANIDAGKRVRTRFAPLAGEREAEIFAVEYSCPGPKPDVRANREPPLGIGISDSRARLNHVQQLALDVSGMIETFAPDFPA
jgi:hypothetical protein